MSVVYLGPITSLVVSSHGTDLYRIQSWLKRRALKEIQGGKRQESKATFSST